MNNIKLPIEDYFNFTIQTTTICDNNIIPKDDPTNLLILHFTNKVSNNITIEKLIEYNFESQYISDFMCPNKIKGAYQTKSLLSLPQYLIIVLQRGALGQQKITTSIKYDTTLTLPTNIMQTFQSHQYRLIAICYHIGDTLLSGHYIAKTYHEGQWYEHNDARVKPINPSELKDSGNTTAYIIIYQRI